MSEVNVQKSAGCNEIKRNVKPVPVNPVVLENSYRGIDYNVLKHKPQIEGNELIGNKTAKELLGFDKTDMDATVSVAKGAEEVAHAANEKAQNAVDIANAAKQTAQGGDGKATQALENSATALETANQAKATADSYQGQITTLRNDVDDLGDQVAAIEGKIPAEATTANQLADKEFVTTITDELAADITALDADVQKINLIKWVEALPATGETKYLYAIPRNEVDKDGKKIVALYLWDGTEWRGAGGTSIDPGAGIYGIKGDYCTTYGIIDAPNGILTNPSGMEVLLKQGVVLQLAGQDIKTTISGDMAHTITSTADCDLFYVSGTTSLMEVAQIVWSRIEPDNGQAGVLAWWNPDNKKWKFKSNDTGNVWAEAVATPVAHIHTNGTTITRIDHIGYRVLDDEVYAGKSETNMALIGKADIDLGNTNMLTNCILSAPNGVMTIDTPISEQLELSDDAVITDRQLTTGNAYFNTYLIKNGFDKSQNWVIKVSFKITSNISKTLFMFRNERNGWTKGPKTYDYLDMFGTIKGTGDTLEFAFLRGFNDGSFYDSSAPSITTPIQLNTEYMAIYDSSGSFGLYQVGTTPPIYHNSSTSYAFATLFPEAQNTGLYTANWESNSGVTPINFNGTNLTYNSGVKTVPVVRDPYTLTVNKGLKVALANGYNADGTPKSEIVTLENDVSVTLAPGDGTFGLFTFLCKLADGSYKILTPATFDFGAVSVIPSNITGYKVYLNTTDNKLYEYGSGFSNIYDKFVLLGPVQLTHGQFTQVFPYKPIQLSLEGLGDYVVESQVLRDGSWYEVWKSGKVRQGGLLTVSGLVGAIVTLLKPFENTAYNIQLTLQAINAEVYLAGASQSVNIANSKTTTSFGVQTAGIKSYDINGISWCAEGQGA